MTNAVRHYSHCVYSFRKEISTFYYWCTLLQLSLNLHKNTNLCNIFSQHYDFVSCDYFSSVLVCNVVRNTFYLRMFTLFVYILQILQYSECHLRKYLLHTCWSMYASKSYCCIPNFSWCSWVLVISSALRACQIISGYFVLRCYTVIFVAQVNNNYFTFWLSLWRLLFALCAYFFMR